MSDALNPFDVAAGSAARAVMVKFLHAWNAFWRGLSTVLKYVADAPIPPNF